ncbi:secretion system protein [Prochlorococcus sp. AH-736-K09]|nr:secretion system protein [Prochlorococcus sp. AH-736-K09]
MKVIKNRKLLLLVFGIFIPLTLISSEVKAGSFGAEIFCTMRDGGNDHESSWEAAYSYIKKQKGGIFKVSPKQAAAQIIETVVREREEFSFCIEYLDNLYPNRKLKRELEKEEKRKKLDNDMNSSNQDLSEDSFDRYSY